MKSVIIQIKHDCCVKLVTFAGQNTLPCKALRGTIGHETVYTSLWLSVSLGILLSIACNWKKRLVHVRIHYPVRKIVINVVTSLNVQVLVFISCLEYLPNPPATSAKQLHSREEFVQTDDI